MARKNPTPSLAISIANLYEATYRRLVEFATKKHLEQSKSPRLPKLIFCAGWETKMTTKLLIAQLRAIEEMGGPMKTMAARRRRKVKTEIEKLSDHQASENLKVTMRKIENLLDSKT